MCVGGDFWILGFSRLFDLLQTPIYDNGKSFFRFTKNCPNFFKYMRFLATFRPSSTIFSTSPHSLSAPPPKLWLWQKFLPLSSLDLQLYNHYNYDPDSTLQFLAQPEHSYSWLNIWRKKNETANRIFNIWNQFDSIQLNPFGSAVLYVPYSVNRLILFLPPRGGGGISLLVWDTFSVCFSYLAICCVRFSDWATRFWRWFPL